MHRSAIRMVQQIASLGLLFAAVFVVRAFAEDKPGDLPPIEGLTERHCTVGPSNVVSRLTAVLVGPGAVRYIPWQYKDKWMLKVSAAPAKKRRTPRGLIGG